MGEFIQSTMGNCLLTCDIMTHMGKKRCTLCQFHSVLLCMDSICSMLIIYFQFNEMNGRNILTYVQKVIILEKNNMIREKKYSTIIWLVLGKVVLDNDFQIIGWTKLDFLLIHSTILPFNTTLKNSTLVICPCDGCEVHH